MVEQFFTIEEVAEILKVHENTVRKILKSGGIRGIKVGREWRITGSAINAFAREAEQDYYEEQDHSKGKYAPLTRYLCDNGRRLIKLSFAEIEEILGFSLPRSARKYNAWWHEEKVPRAQKIAWSDAGYFVREYCIRNETVVFQRKWTDEMFLQEVENAEKPNLKESMTFFLKRVKKLDLELSWGERNDMGKAFHKFEYRGRQQTLFCLYTNGILEINLQSLKKVAPFDRKESMEDLLEKLRTFDPDVFEGDLLECHKTDLVRERYVPDLEELIETFGWVLDSIRAEQ